MTQTRIAIIGGGLAGCECALVLAQTGIAVTLFEQKPDVRSPAHASPLLAELVCSNSLRSAELTSGVGLLKEELRQLHSPFMAAADACRIPADKALAVDRERFAQAMTEAVEQHPNVQLVCSSVASLDDPQLQACGAEFVVLAAGPLLDGTLAESLFALLGQEQHYFYDAIAPIVWTHSLDMDIVFRASRYDCERDDIAAGSGDYLNCPMTREEYDTFYAALCEAQTVPTRDFEKARHFEGCMPIEALAARGPRTLSFGPLKPVGFIDPRTGRRPWAVLQLRAENSNADTCNLVGCQTRMTQAEQKRVFRLVPGMAQAEFARLGSMHRNTYVNAPEVLAEDLSLRAKSTVFLAGQITGVEGYVESAACGHWLGRVLAARVLGNSLAQPPQETALGALLQHLRTPAKHFQPSNVHFGLMPELGERCHKKERKARYASRAQEQFIIWRAGCGL